MRTPLLDIQKSALQRRAQRAAEHRAVQRGVLPGMTGWADAVDDELTRHPVLTRADRRSRRSRAEVLHSRSRLSALDMQLAAQARKLGLSAHSTDPVAQQISWMRRLLGRALAKPA